MTAPSLSCRYAFPSPATTWHKIRTEELRSKPRVRDILNAAKEGMATAHLNNVSRMHLLEVLSHDATRAEGRELDVDAPRVRAAYLSFVSNRTWPRVVRAPHADPSPLPLRTAQLGHAAGVAVKVLDKVLDAMRPMSDGVTVVGDDTNGR
ncbi:hypothetical protein LXA43DRAFT_1099430 [Ganoderma leucocontextum]|nr:hypothetical protein LXA43DRAFT_1099430 [Ganoderma leucocontextum]